MRDLKDRLYKILERDILHLRKMEESLLGSYIDQIDGVTLINTCKIIPIMESDGWGRLLISYHIREAIDMILSFISLSVKPDELKTSLDEYLKTLNRKDRRIVKEHSDDYRLTFSSAKRITRIYIKQMIKYIDGNGEIEPIIDNSGVHFKC